MNSGDTTQHGANLPSWQSVAGGRSQKDIISTLSRQAPNQVSERKFAKNVLKRFSRRPAVQERGSGEEKAARKSASLPGPNNPQTPHQPSIAPLLSLRSASGEVEQKHEAIFPLFCGKIASCFCGSFSSRRPTAAESDSAPYAAPAPCRTQGVRGAADTPPASHNHTAPESPRPRGGLKTQLAAWQTVMTIWPKISSATQPRDRSFSGFASPWRIGP